jgi:DNA-binding response OmpR family regulator
MTKNRTAKHIFVINDEPTLLVVFRELLEDEGFRVSLETFNDSTLEGQYGRILDEKPDLIVLDFLIGGELLGWQFLQLLRLRRETAKIPIVVCTAAKRTVEERSDHLTQMAVGVVLKPFDIDHLLAEIRKALDATPDNPWSLAKPD